MNSLFMILLVGVTFNGLIDLNVRCVDSSDSILSREVAEGANCGVLCAERVIHLHKKIDIPFSEIIHPKYISTKDGSTVSDLMSLLSDFGVAATAKSNVGLGTLSQLVQPAILHVRRSEFSVKYDHWILFLGRQNENFLVVDLPGNPFEMSGSELLSIWDGTAIFTSDKGQGLPGIYFEWLFHEFLPIAAIVFVPMGLAFLLAGSAPKSLIGSVMTMVMVGCFIGISRNLLFEGGMLRDFETTTAILRLRTPTAIAESNDRQAFSNAVAIDSRFEPDYLASHVKCAINIPVFSSRAEILEKLKDVERKSKIVIYCQSSRCSFSHTIAERLAFEGYSDLTIFVPGWIGLGDEQ